MAKRATAGVKPEAEEKPAKRQKPFEEVGAALKMQGGAQGAAGRNVHLAGGGRAG